MKPTEALLKLSLAFFVCGLIGILGNIVVESSDSDTEKYVYIVGISVACGCVGMGIGRT